MHLLSLLSGTLGAVLSASILAPQAFRAVRKGTAGVSPTTIQIGAAIALTWTAYAIPSRLWLLGIGNAVLALSAFVAMWALHRDGSTLRQLFAVLIPVMAVVGLIGFINPLWMGWCGGALSVTMRFPQLRLVRNAPSIHGVSIHTWVISASCNVCWLTYGLINSDSQLTVAGFANSLTSSTLVLAVLIRRRSEGLELIEPQPHKATSSPDR